MSHTLPIWWPNKPPIYAIEKSYLENLEQGPRFDGKIPERNWKERSLWKDFLGFPVASCLGVPAGPLLNSQWVRFAAAMGFDIVTYKTIRSKVHPAHAAPNMIYIETNGPLTQERSGEILHQRKTPPLHMNALAVTNSFGIPSKDRDYLLSDIAKAQDSLVEGQVMIVSIVGTPRPEEDFVEDFVLAACLAKDAGAQIIEADFSCPNVTTCEGDLFANAASVYEISSKIKQAIGSIPLVIKMGVIRDSNVLKEVLVAAARADVSAVCGINTVSMRVVKEDGSPALGPNRLRSGVCGGPIREAALSFLHAASQINRQEKLGLTLMGTGGVTEPEHFDLFFEAGADVAMSAVGMMWDPYLAARYHATH